MNQKENNKVNDPSKDENESTEMIEQEEQSLAPVAKKVEEEKSSEADDADKEEVKAVSDDSDEPKEEVKEEAKEEVVEEKVVEKAEEPEIKEEKEAVSDDSDEPKAVAEENSDKPKEEVVEKEKEKEDDSELDTSKISFGEDEEDERLWYVVNTYSGYEDNVAQALKQRIDSMDMNDKIFDVIVPKEKKVEIKNGKKKIVEKKIFPGYVLVQMEIDEDSWYVVRNTPSVTGFIGFGNTPTALSVEEVKSIQKRMGIEEPEFKIDYEIGESVKIVDGPFKDFDGVISDIDKIRGKIKVLVSMFGRETPVELDALQIQRI